jgi:hypothetical protein
MVPFSLLLPSTLFLSQWLDFHRPPFQIQDDNESPAYILLTAIFICKLQAVKDATESLVVARNSLTCTVIFLILPRGKSKVT